MERELRMKISKNKLLIYCVVLIGICFNISACNKQPQDLKIGIIGTMSGINSDLSVSGRRGVELAIDEINASGGIKGRKIDLVIKDDKNNADTALKMYEEFISENIKIIIGPYTSGIIVKTIDQLRYKDFLMLGPTVSADSLSGRDDNFIRFIATTNEQAQAITDMAKKNNHKKFAVLYDYRNMGFNEALYNNFEKLLYKNNGEVVFNKYFNSDKKEKYEELAAEVSKSNAEALFIIANAADNAEITQQIRKNGCEVHIYSPLWSNTEDLIKKGGSAVDKMYIIGGIDINSDKGRFVEFKNNFINKYGDKPTFSTVYSYETAMVLFQAMKMGPNIEPSAIKQNIIRISKFNGLQNDFHIDKYGDSTREYIMLRIQKGQLRKVD